MWASYEKGISMSITDSFLDMSLALGQGVYSVGQDVILGFDRTTEGLGLGKNGRVAQIGFENNVLAGMLSDLVQLGINNKDNPLFKAISIILENYYMSLSDEDIQTVAKKVGIAASYSLGRMVLGKKLAEAIALRIATSIATTAAFKMLASKIGVASGVSATGIGVPIGLLMMQGVLQRSSLASQRLRVNRPQLYKALQQRGNLQFIYFILEKPMEKHINAIPKL